MVPDAVLMDTQEELTDLLDRKAFVARLIDVVEILSENRKNASFAVNGAWGVGKTFVLNRFEEQNTRLRKTAQENIWFSIMIAGNMIIMRNR